MAHVMNAHAAFCSWRRAGSRSRGCWSRGLARGAAGHQLVAGGALDLLSSCLASGVIQPMACVRMLARPESWARMA